MPKQNKQILLIEDDQETAETLQIYLEAAGYQVAAEGDGLKGLNAAREGHFDLFIIDLMLPGLDGKWVCQAIREESDVPIILLTALGAEADRIYGFEIGADDYVVKPFSPREIVARVKARLKTNQTRNNTPLLKVGDITADTEGKKIWVQGQEISLTATEYKLLVTMMSAPGRAFTRDELVIRAFGHDYDGTEQTIAAHIYNLRQRIEPSPHEPRYVETVFGFGYRLNGKQRR